MESIFYAQCAVVGRSVKLLAKAIFLWIVLAAPVSFVFALNGNIGTHDPTTIMLCDGKYYAYGTGGNTHVSCGEAGLRRPHACARGTSARLG